MQTTLGRAVALSGTRSEEVSLCPAPEEPNPQSDGRSGESLAHVLVDHLPHRHRRRFDDRLSALYRDDYARAGYLQAEILHRVLTHLENHRRRSLRLEPLHLDLNAVASRRQRCEFIIAVRICCGRAFNAQTCALHRYLCAGNRRTTGIRYSALDAGSGLRERCAAQAREKYDKEEEA